MAKKKKSHKKVLPGISKNRKTRIGSPLFPRKSPRQFRDPDIAYAVAFLRDNPRVDLEKLKEDIKLRSVNASGEYKEKTAEEIEEKLEIALRIHKKLFLREINGGKRGFGFKRLFKSAKSGTNSTGARKKKK